jgi:glucan phosphoethanolaminetransferase (alkaline phosphatase superfamily)
MRLPFTRSALFIIASYLLLSALPFLSVLLGRALTTPVLVVAGTLLSWLAIWALFGRPAFFHPLLLPAFLALPAEVYLQLYFGQGISSHHLGVIAETGPMEALEFLADGIWLLAAVLMLVVAWFVAIWRAALRCDDLDWRGPTRLVVLAVLGVGAAVWVYGGAAMSGSSPALREASAGKHRDLPDWARISVNVPVLASSWPYGLAFQAYAFLRERIYLRQLSERSEAFRFHAHQDAVDKAPRIVVMVLGESSRADRWSLNGYARRTNPLLEQERNLVSFSDLVTPVSATRLSVPVIMSRKPATQSLRAGFSEKSFLSAYKEAGYKTFWLSNQMSFGEFDTPVSVFAKEADVTRFFNLGGFRNDSSHDEVLLSPLEQAMRDPADRKLIVLHTLGSHWNYSQRYPRQFDRFQPSLFGIDKPAYTDLKLKAEISNSYDNAILYTDWLLSQVIARLKAAQAVTAMMYAADHGQTLYDGSCRLAFHGHNTQFEFHVPGLVWYSDAYDAAYPDKVAQLRRHRDAPLSTENVFHSLLDMADIHYPDERLGMSLFSKQLGRHVRYVDSYGWTDYDDANFKGDCREVIGRKTPLPRDR